MGLDITAYTKLTKVADGTEELRQTEGYDWRTQWLVTPGDIALTEKDFPGRTIGLAPGLYSYAKRHDFRAGSYSGYNDLRRWLAVLAGHGTPEAVWAKRQAAMPCEGPFVELIDFSDCEGIIGPVVSAKLARDFADFQDRVGDFGYDAQLYGHWRRAFEMAADGGAVDFH